MRLVFGLFVRLPAAALAYTARGHGTAAALKPPRAEPERMSPLQGPMEQGGEAGFGRELGVLAESFPGSSADALGASLSTRAAALPAFAAGSGR
jgi:hypothetical protein